MDGQGGTALLACNASSFVAVPETIERQTGFAGAWPGEGLQEERTWAQRADGSDALEDDGQTRVLAR